MTLHTYAIIDGAVEDELLPMLEQFDPPVSCLYAEPVQEDLIEIAPYLVLVTDEVSQWLKTRDNSWGFYFTSTADLKTVRQHWRKHLQAIVDGEEKPVFFRFYDPRNIWLLCDLLSDWQLYQFLGPVEAITTDIDGVILTNDFKARREQFPKDAVARRKMLTFDMDQMSQVTRHMESRYIAELSERMKQWSTDEMADYQDFAGQIFYYMQQLEVTDDRTICGIARLFLRDKYSCLDDVPQRMKNRLEALDHSAQTNAEKLLIDELGSVPLLTD